VLTAEPRLLEVGALKPDNYRGCCSWIENTPIDLNAQDPGIRQQDFLQMEEDENACKWDVLSLSLVLNFVPDPRERGTGSCSEEFHSCLIFPGRMLRLAHLFLDASRTRCGLLFVTVGIVRTPLGNWWLTLITWCSFPCRVCRIRATSHSTILRV